MKQFADEFRSRIDDSIKKGNVFSANEIEANITIGSITTFIMTLLLISFVLNEVGVFTTNKQAMRIAVLLALLIEAPIATLNKKYHGDKPWLRAALSWGLIAVCVILATLLGHNVTLLMVMPVVASIRYCNPSNTRKVFMWSLLDFTLATVGNAFLGVVNLNVYNPPAGTVLTIETTLRKAIEVYGYDRAAYFKQLIFNDYIPKLLIFLVIGLTCILIAKKGKDMVELQANVSEKASRINTELQLATEIQADMLPCIFPAFPTHGELELYAKNVPAKEMGGDLYDYFTIDDDHAAIVIADVSGKGIGAALFMTIAKIVIKNQLSLCKSPAQALANANNQLCENNNAGLFVTAWAGVYEISSGKLTFSNAGHNPPVIMRGKECEYLKSRHGLVLAAMENARYKDEMIELNKGDEIFLYTDGVTEATNIRDELYGEDRLLEYLSGAADKTVKEQIDTLYAELDKFAEGAEQFDDITVLAMKVKPSAE